MKTLFRINQEFLINDAVWIIRKIYITELNISYFLYNFSELKILILVEWELKEILLRKLGIL